MTDWCHTVLHMLVLDRNKLTFVADPDYVLTEEKLNLALRSHGFDIIDFEDSTQLRFLYETVYRPAWKRGEQKDLIVILHSSDIDFTCLPYDLYIMGKKVSLSLGSLFPTLSYPVLESLDTSVLDILFGAQMSSTEAMGDKASKDFILRHVFAIAPEMIGTNVELLRVLLRLHYGALHLPKSLLQRLLSVLLEKNIFHDWPLETIIDDSDAFFNFLQEKWATFITSLEQSPQLCENPSLYGQHFSSSNIESNIGPNISSDTIPFSHCDIKVYMDNLFVEGKLTPVCANLPNHIAPWIQNGVLSKHTDSTILRIERLFAVLEKSIPSIDARYQDWMIFAPKWAELSSLVHCHHEIDKQNQLRTLGQHLNDVFSRWLLQYYAGLSTMPPTKPVMVHHIARSMARSVEQSQHKKAALLVIDGLSLDQWATLRALLQSDFSDIHMHESVAFAWIPTLTSVSRQAIFSGKVPQYFPTSITSTHLEASLWKQFWEGYGFSSSDVVYQRGLGDKDIETTLKTSVNLRKTPILGLVIDTIDKIMHGMQLGSAGMHNQIIQWYQKGFLRSLLTILLDYGYSIWLTSDHGNVECNGIGRPAEGVIPESKGERVRIYSSKELRAQSATFSPAIQEWPTIGLPQNYAPLVCKGYAAFIKQDDTTVGHGGISIEETLVPLIRIDRRPRDTE